MRRGQEGRGGRRRRKDVLGGEDKRSGGQRQGWTVFVKKEGKSGWGGVTEAGEGGRGR